jgi:signal transduction histidine kinase
MGERERDAAGGERHGEPDGDPRSADERLASLALFAGGVAHDLNNMLAVTLSLCEALARDERLGESARERVDAIRESTQRAADLVRRLLGLGRAAPQAHALVDVNATVTDVSRLVGRVLGDDVRVVVDLCPGLPRVPSDATHLEQALMNLMLNARAAMRDGGTIRVVTERRDAARGFDGAEIGPCVVVAVADTGAGMTPEVLARIFQPFFSARSGGGGVGLGLSSVHRWLRDGGGVVHVESQPGRGTTFTLALPCAAREA